MNFPRTSGLAAGLILLAARVWPQASRACRIGGAVSLFSFALVLLTSLSPAWAGLPQVVPVGQVCDPNTNAGDIQEQSAECTGTAFQRPAFQFGAAVAACAAGTAGMVQWTASTLQYCDGSNWKTVTNTGSGTALNAISAATGNQAGIANAAYTIQWNWDTLAGGSALKLSSISTAATGSTQKMFEIALSGTNGTSAQTTYGEYISNTHAGTTSTNYGLYSTASGGTTQNIGVLGTTSTTVNNSVGVYGYASGGSGTVIGVEGDAVSASGYGVIGTNTASGGVGVAGTNYGAGIGVLGSTSSTTNNAMGVYGHSSGASGIVYGVLGDSASASGYGGYFTNTGGGYALATDSGAVKLGTAGTAMSAMGVCTVASYTPSTATAAKTCTGVPASTAVAVYCSASGAFSPTPANGVYARANGTLNQIEVNTHAANTAAVTLTCMWVQP